MIPILNPTTKIMYHVSCNNIIVRKLCNFLDIFDITENVDSVYSLQFMMDKNTNENENLSEEKMKLIRYTIKKRKELNKRKSKGRGKNFSNEEDQRLLNCVKRKGPKFHKFFRQFPGKTPNMLKNRYYKQLRFAWDHISDKQNHHFNFLPKEQMAIIQKDFGQFKKEDIEKLQLFPEAKKLLSNFLGCLSSVFININSIFLQENIQ
ncbi:unnamed protein product [Paramecium pentaurelia]|uniref:HTH myb-type domain-containing protein n=1 Tax=Paramecium pentaurelia TaxID=43138 RepID=A0A8S1SFJ6_9CILI|nr:unnamed protein product [Paramecium pentaurelia]